MKKKDVAMLALVDVVRETFALLKYKYKFVLCMVVASLIASAPLQWIMTANGTMDYSAEIGLAVLFAVFFGTALQVITFAHFIFTLRGEPSTHLFHGFISKFFKTLFRELLVVLAVVLPGLLTSVAFVFSAAFLFPGGRESAGFDFAVGIASIIGVWLGMGWLALRWGAGIAGAAVGEKVSFKESWRMTKGHSWKLMLFILPAFLVQQISTAFIGPAMDQGTYSFFSPDALAAILTTGATYWFSFAGLSVWYVRLSKRYEATNETMNYELSDQE